MTHLYYKNNPMIDLILFFILPNEVVIEEEVFPENIEYCQNVYMTWNNPLNQVCDFEQTKRSLNINF